MNNLDPKNIIIANAYLKAKLTLPVAPATPDKPSSYDIDFGCFEDLSLKIGGDLKEIWGGTATGGLGLLDLRRVKGDITIEAQMKNLPPTTLAYLFGSASGGAPTPGKITKLFFWLGLAGEGEPIVAAPNSNEGAGIITYYGWRGALAIDGDVKADGTSEVAPKLTVRALLADTPGVWAGPARPVVAAP